MILLVTYYYLAEVVTDRAAGSIADVKIISVSVTSLPALDTKNLKFWHPDISKQGKEFS